MVSPTTTDFSVAVVSPLAKFSPPESFTVSGLAAAHAASFGLPSSTGAAVARAATSVLTGAGLSAVEQAASARAIRGRVKRDVLSMGGTSVDDSAIVRANGPEPLSCLNSQCATKFRMADH